jgi:excisionase family DNA binding protein
MTSLARERVTRLTPVGELPELVRVDEMAAWLGIGQSLAREMVRRADVPHVRLGRLVRVPRWALTAMVNGEKGSAE